MLKIDVVSHQGRPIADPISAVFNSAGGGIGRHPDSFLALPDPQRHLSRRHAQISWRDNAYVIENTTTNNFVIVSGHTLHPNEFCVLQEGHQIYIGHYLLEVSALAANTGRGYASQAPARQPASTAQPQSACPSPPPANAILIDDMWPDLPSAPMALPDDPVFAERPVPDSAIASIAPSSPAVVPRAEEFRDQSSRTYEHYDMRDIAAAKGGRPASGVSSILGSDDLLGMPSDGNPFAILHAKTPAAMPADPLIHPGDLNLAHIEPNRRAKDDDDPFALPSLDLRNASDPLFDQPKQISLRDLVGQTTNIDNIYGGDSLGSLPGIDPLAETEPVKSLGTFEPRKSLDPLALFASDASSVQSLLDMSPAVVMDDHSDQLVMHLDLPRAVPAKSEKESTTGPDNEKPARPTVLAESDPGHGTGLLAAPLQEQPQRGQESVPVPAVNVMPAAEPLVPEAAAGEAPPMPAPAADAAAQDSDEHQHLIQAFLKSAGLPKEMVPQRLTPEFMEAVGAMLFTSMQGTVDLIAARAATKREVKAEMTLILPVHNNPLKFVPDGRAALIHMFGKQIPGFLGPIEAMKDAYQDLRAHQVGVFAGMRAALAEVLQRFSPDDVEKRLEQQSMIDSLMPGHRKAKLWDLYGQQFKKIYAEAQEDFDVIFGDAFAVAYEEQTRSMRAGLGLAKNKDV